MPIYRDIYDGPPRWFGPQRTEKGYIAIHCTANTASAEAENAYAKRRPDSVSSHYYVDHDSIVQSLDTDLRAFHAGSKIGNDHAIAYEITGLTSWSRQRWLDSVAWPLLVRQIRRDMAAHNIAARRLTVAQMKARELSGIVTHNDMRLAWGGTDHTDPGRNFPMDHLLKLLIEEDGMPDPKDLWKYRGYDYVNVDDRPTTKDHQLARAHQYTWETRKLVRELLAEQEKAAEREQAILAAVAGDSHDAILAKLDQHAAEARAHREQIAARLEGVLDQVAELVAEDSDPAAVVAAVRELLGRVRVSVDPEDG